MTTAIVTGVTGQDGYYAARLLQRRGIDVIGLTRDVATAASEFDPETFPTLKLVSFDYSKIGAFSEIVEHHNPDLIFNFAAKATGQGMFDAPQDMCRLNGTFVLDILESIRNSARSKEISFCQASSSEMFGNATESPQSEQTAFRPKSPYGAAKLYAHNSINVYRATYGLRCSSAILYNHESVRRSTQFVTKKIANAAAAIKLGLAQELVLGSLSISRDWGYAPEYVEAMYLMATAELPQDYVVATGRINTIGRLCELAFGHLDLDYRDFVRVSADAVRAIESINLQGNPAKIQTELSWRAATPISDIIVELVDYELERLRHTAALDANIGPNHKK